MRTPNIGTISYEPGTPPSDPRDLKKFLQDELLRIKYTIDLLALGHLDQTHVAPAKPRTGDIRLADGTDWDPGAGQGVYAYYNSTWNKLG